MRVVQNYRKLYSEPTVFLKQEFVRAMYAIEHFIAEVPFNNGQIFNVRRRILQLFQNGEKLVKKKENHKCVERSIHATLFSAKII